jgi:threonine dehydrogenase-like Zn-dependent dehydrogenase
MKALVYAAPKVAKLVDIPEPRVAPGLVKIRLEYAAICATDLHVVMRGFFNREFNTGLGHEGSGIVVEMGEGTEGYGFEVGDKVCMTDIVSCGICGECMSGRGARLCQHKPTVKQPMIAEYITCPVQQVYKIPAAGDLRKYCLVEPLSCAVHGMDIAKIRQGETVCISGAGGIGLLHLLLIVRKGATKITVIEPVAAKRKLALKLGADYVIVPVNENVVEQAMRITEGRGFDVVYETSGAPKAGEICMDLMAGYGKIVYFAVYPMDYMLPLNLFQMFKKEGTVHGVGVSTSNFQRTINIMAKLLPEMDKIIGLELPLDRAEEAFREFATSKYPKVIIKCQK